MLKRVKKLISLGAITILTLGVVGCSNSNQEDKLKVGLILSVGGVNDESFNQSAWEGALKASEELGVEVSYLESNSDADYMQNIETSIDQGNDLVVGIGFQVGDAILEAAKAYPEQKFVAIDSTYEEELENLRSITFN